MFWVIDFGPSCPAIITRAIVVDFGRPLFHGVCSKLWNYILLILSTHSGTMLNFPRGTCAFAIMCDVPLVDYFVRFSNDGFHLLESFG